MLFVKAETYKLGNNLLYLMVMELQIVKNGNHRKFHCLLH